MENTLLNKAKALYPKDTLFLSSTGNLKSPMRVSTLKESETYKGSIYNSEGGCIYDGLNWAKKV